MPDGQMAITLKGNPAHLDDVIQMLQGKPAQEAAGGSPAMPMAAPPPPPASSPLLGMVMPQNGSADAAGMPMTSMSSLPPRPRSLLGKVEHGLGIAGEIAGTAFAPRLMPFIPGTMQNRMMQEDRAQGLQDEETDRALKGGQAEEAKARAYALMHPAEKGAGEAQATVTSGGQAYEWNPETQRYDIPIGSRAPEKDAPRRAEFFMGPDGKPVQGYSEGGKNFLASGDPLPDGYAPFKPATAPSGHPVAGSIANNPAWGLFDPQKGWLDPTTHAPLKGFTPPPTWAEVMPATHTQTLTNPETGLPTVYQYNAQTKTFSQPAGIAGTGTYSHQIQSAHAVQRMVNDNVLPLIDKMQKAGEMGVFKGRFSDWLDRDVGNAPPDVAQLHQLVNGVVSMMMGLYGFRRQQAVEALDKQMGARMTPESMRASLQGVMEHAQSIIGSGTAAVGRSGGQSKPLGETTKPDGVYEMNGKRYRVSGGKVYAD